MAETDDLSVLRHHLHKFPEISGSEYKTAEYIKEYFSNLNPDKVIESIGGSGIAFVYSARESGPVVLFRAELDALPMKENAALEYSSQHDGAAHKCGHDGHMTILCGVGRILHKNPPKKGKVVLLFQPAEETGQGARQVLSHPKWDSIKPDYVFALHNLPGFPAGEILMREGNFSSASAGFEAFLTGKTSHAAEPAKGNNPAAAIADIIKDVNHTLIKTSAYSDFVLATIINVVVGEKAFGTSAGEAIFRATLRASRQDDFTKLKDNAEALVKKHEKKHKLELHVNWVEEFPVTNNNTTANQFVLKAAEKNTLKVSHIDEPFRWSEDFGWFLQNYPGALFGLGAGQHISPLHHPDYDFNDDILQTGVSMFKEIYLQLNC